jgi:hypothetical protein
MLIDTVNISPGRIGLPDLDERIADRSAAFVQYPPAHDDPLADRIAVSQRVSGQILIKGTQIFVPINRGRAFGQASGDRNQGPGRPAQGSRPVWGMPVGWMAVPVTWGNSPDGGLVQRASPLIRMIAMPGWLRDRR